MGAEQINWDSDSSPQSLAEIFDEAFPYYLSLGMDYDVFWNGRPEIVKAYRKAEEMKRNRENEMMWLGGMYTAHALQATVGNVFGKGKKHEYPAEPLPITQKAVEAKRNDKVEKAKARMMAFAARWNEKHSDAALNRKE